MPRRSASTSTRRSRRSNNRKLPMNRPSSTANRRTEENELETSENVESEDSDEADRPGRESTGHPTGQELIELDLDDGVAPPVGSRRRSDKATTPQRGLNKKKARFDLTNEDTSEEEITFEDCHSMTSSKGSTTSPPEPRRLLCHSTDTPMNQHQPDPSMVDDSSLDSEDDDDNSDAPKTMAAALGNNPRPMQPAVHNIFKSCRYSAQLLVPPTEEPVKQACELLQNVFKEIQRQAGSQVWLAAWQSSEDNLVCKKPTDIPIGTSSDNRDFYTRIFDNYLSLTPDAEKRLFLKIHFITQSPDALKIPLKELGLKVQTLTERFGFRLNPNPNPCQSSKVSTIGWGFGTVKAMDSDKLLQAVREFLKIPDHVVLGAQWRTITDQHGKKYPWPKDNTLPRPPQALHFDIDNAYMGVWYPKFSKLWKKGATKKVNYLQIRLVPCFTTQVGKNLTPVQHSGTVYMAQKQAHFVNLHTTRLTNSNILSIDTPVGENKVTLRRYLMMKAPEGLITDRIFISVDQAYRGNDFVLTVPKVYADQAIKVLHNMIPECLHLYGEQAARWFTNIGLIAYQDVTWDPLLNATTSTNDENVTETVEENFFGMGSGWMDTLTAAADAQSNTPTHIEGMANVGPTVGEILNSRARRGIHDDTSSFGDAFGRSHSGSTIAPPRPAASSRNRRVGFRTDSSTGGGRESPPDDVTISTMGTEATTGSTRRNLRHQVEINEALRSEGAQIAEDRDRLQEQLLRLQEQLSRQGLTLPSDEQSSSTQHSGQPSASRGLTSTGADSAGRKN